MDLAGWERQRMTYSVSTRRRWLFTAASCGPGLAARSGPARRPLRNRVPIRVARLRLVAVTNTAALARVHGPMVMTAVANCEG